MENLISFKRNLTDVTMLTSWQAANNTDVQSICLMLLIIQKLHMSRRYSNHTTSTIQTIIRTALMKRMFYASR